MSNTIRLSSLRGKTYDLKFEPSDSIHAIKHNLLVSMYGIDMNDSQKNTQVEIMYEGETLADKATVGNLDTDVVFYYILNSPAISIPKPPKQLYSPENPYTSMSPMSPPNPTSPMSSSKNSLDSHAIGLPVVKNYIQTPTDSLLSSGSFENHYLSDVSKRTTKSVLTKKSSIRNKLSDMYLKLDEYQEGIREMQKSIEYILAQLPKDS